MKSWLQKIRETIANVGTWSETPAAMIDDAYREEPKSRMAKGWQRIKIRSLYSAAFIPAAVIDVATSGSISLMYAVRSFFRSDDVQDGYLAKQKHYATLFSKNLYALVMTPLGVYDPKLVYFYFVPERRTKGVASGANYYYLPDAKRKEPKTVDEICMIMQKANAKDYKVMPVGAGFSQGKQFLPEGGKGAVVIDCKHFNTIQINARDKTAIVGAGAHWGDLQKAADKHKLAVADMQASNVFSIGGAASINAHGWNHLIGVLANTILEMEVVLTNGEHRLLTPADELFHHFTGGLGLYGVMISLKLQLIDNELLVERGVSVPIDEYVDYFNQQVLTDESIRMHLYRLSLDPAGLLLQGVAVNYVREGEKKVTTTPYLEKEGQHGTRFNRIMVNLARRSDYARAKYWEMESKRLLANESKPMTTNAIMRPPIYAMIHAAQSEGALLEEYFLPGENLANFLRQLSKLLTDNHVPLLNCSVRYVKKHDKSPLSYAAGGNRFAVVICFNQAYDKVSMIKARKWLRKAEELTVKLGGSYYPCYMDVSSIETYELAFPRVREARQMKKIVDPKEILSSGFYQKYIKPEQVEISPFKLLMASESLKTKFAGFLKNVLQRVNDKKLYALLDDILQYKDTHAEIYQELCDRLPEIVPSAISTVSNVLSSLSHIKTDLAAQAAILLEDTEEIIGLVEIGYPGRFINGFTKQFKVTGNIVAVYEGPALTDYIQTGFPRPYSQFAKLDYANPTLANLPDNSAEVITCYIGLHHFPTDKLPAFLNEIRRVLKEGGHFLLVDHDVDCEESYLFAVMAHVIFNAVNGISLQDELQEIRNFQSMAYWQEKLREHGLGYDVQAPDVPLIRDGDPSRNRMTCFKKPVCEPELLVVASVVNPVTGKVVTLDWKNKNAAKQIKLSKSQTSLVNQFSAAQADEKIAEISRDESKIFNRVG